MQKNSDCAKNAKSHDILFSLKQKRDSHPIWTNPLLQACEQGQLTFADFQYLFSQYYHYSKAFSRLLAAVMANCENDYYRSKLAENLWEESGEAELEKRHAEIFRKFLHEGLHISSLENIVFEPFTIEFVHQYFQLCLEQLTLEATAALSLGTEGIVAKLYTIFRNGLLQAGISDEQLRFFHLHIACDDAHAETLEEMVHFYVTDEKKLLRAEKAMLQALDLRHTFFLKLYQGILNRRLEPLVKKISYAPSLPEKLFSETELLSNIHLSENVLYHNQDNSKGISFWVKRVPFEADVLDPRLVTIPPHFSNEYHQHAHETIFLILSGRGEVLINTKIIPIKAGDIVFVPRWLSHQTRNTGDTDLTFFAITDYGFTKRIPQNNETIYRLKPENVEKTLSIG